MKQTILIICMVVAFFLAGINVFASEVIRSFPMARMSMFQINNSQAYGPINIKPAAFLRTVNIQAKADTSVEKLCSKVNNALAVWADHMPIPIDAVDGKDGKVLIYQVFSKSF